MSRIKLWLARNDVGLGSVIAFVGVPFIAALVAALDKAGVAWWELTPDQLWALGKGAFLSVLTGLVGRFGQAIAQKWGRGTITPRTDDVVVEPEDVPVDVPEELI